MRRMGLLGFLQIATLLALGALLVASLLLLRYRTDDYFTPLTAYLLSLKVALPPAAVFVGTYAIAFLTGTALGDVPRVVLGYVRNKYFQSLAMMAATLVASVAAVAYVGWIYACSTPPAYEQLVMLLLGGSSDNMAVVRERVDLIRKLDPSFGVRMTKVVEVFAERSAVNAGRAPSGERVRTLVRALEADDEPGWVDHPLRQHALAEAYSMFGQSVARATTTAVAVRPHDAWSPYRKAIELYGRVSSSTSPLAPQALRTSARSNTGNAHYYMGDNESALRAWREASRYQDDQPNLAPWSNVIAALVMLDRPEEALAEGERARAWAEKSGKALIETYSFSGVLENTAFAKLELGNVEDAVSDFATANAFREDDLAKQNLALSLVLAGRPGEAREILRQLAPPVAIGVEPSPKVAACVYLIWGLALPSEPFGQRGANFSAFLGERLAPGELEAATAADVGDLMARVAAALPNSARPCGSLGKIRRAMALLTPPTLPRLDEMATGEPIVPNASPR